MAKKQTKKKSKKTGKELLTVDDSTYKKCPRCKIFLSSKVFYNTEVNYCPKCLGIWFDDEELRWAKDEKDKDLKWLDIDLWENKRKFKISRGERFCPSCRMPLYEVYYGDSGIIVDVCNLCHGVWLDRAEFRKIIEWLRKEADYRVLNKYGKSLFDEAIEIFTGPETLKEEISDFLVILKLLNYKFATQYPTLSKIISQLPK